MITVIADDITGAAEIAGVCLRYGLKVGFGIDIIPTNVTDVLIIATDSRSMSEENAYKTHWRLAHEIVKKNPETILFKKCDSVLRGYVLSELSALLDVFDFKNVLLQPANPLSGRTIRDGLYYFGTDMIENTLFSNDPDFPAKTSLVQNLILNRSKLHTNIIEIQFGKISKIIEEGVCIPDCTSEVELQQCYELTNEKTLLCGSAAFFEQMLIKKGFLKVVNEKKQTIITENFLFVLGSAQLESADFIKKIHQLNCPVISFPDYLLNEKIDDKELNEWSIKLADKWNQNKRLTIFVSENKIDFPESSLILKERLSKVVMILLKECEIQELLVGGGATAYSILKLLKLKTLLPVNELSAGVLRMQIAHHPKFFLTLKPGSYMWPEKLFIL